jgi:hypothetical protein
MNITSISHCNKLKSTARPLIFWWLIVGKIQKRIISWCFILW